MDNEKGFITIIALFTMVIIFISALFLVYISNMEYLIVNSSRNNIQTCYLAESKIYLVLGKEEYYYQQLVPRIETYLRYGRLGKYYNNKIVLDTKDLIEGDNNVVKVGFGMEDNRRILELKTHSKYFGVIKKILAKATIINDLFEMRIPILSLEYVQQDRLKEFKDYILYLKEEIEISDESSGIMGIEALDYEEIDIIKKSNNMIDIEFLRNNTGTPIKTKRLVDEEVFVLAKNNSKYPVVSIKTEKDLDKLVLKGVLYLDGDLRVYDDFEFHGILILNNGEFFIEPFSKIKIEGIVLLHNYYGFFSDDERIQVNYNLDQIKKYGIYLPRFINPKIKIIRNN